MPLPEKEKLTFPSDAVEDILLRHNVDLPILSPDDLIDNLIQGVPDKVKLVRDIAFSWNKGDINEDEVIIELSKLLGVTTDIASKISGDIEKEVFPLFIRRSKDNSDREKIRPAVKQRNINYDDSYREPLE